MARSLGAAPLAADLEVLVRRGRLAAGSTPDQLLRRLGLTEREAEVLGLLVEGRTNRQIGELLFISEKTVSVHVTNLLRKLGVESRTEAAEMSRRLRLPGGRSLSSRHADPDASGRGTAGPPGLLVARRK